MQSWCLNWRALSTSHLRDPGHGHTAAMLPWSLRTADRGCGWGRHQVTSLHQYHCIAPPPASSEIICILHHCFTSLHHGCGYLVWLVFDLLCLCRLLARVQQFLHQCKSIINVHNLQIIHLLMPSPCWKPIWTLSHHIKILHLKLGCLSAKPKPMGSC